MKIEHSEILVADDNAPSLAMIRRALRDIGFHRIQVAPDGYQALVILKKIPVDLLLVDWNLAKLNGYAVVKHLLRITRIQYPKVIMMTSESDTKPPPEDGEEMGIDAYLVRPFTNKTLRDRVEKVLGKI
jgi:PleD family two-component response regulator